MIHTAEVEEADDADVVVADGAMTDAEPERGDVVLQVLLANLAGQFALDDGEELLRHLFMGRDGISVQRATVLLECGPTVTEECFSMLLEAPPASSGRRVMVLVGRTLPLL